ncbi:SDR family oxidoreductase [bacterium]|nr:SDR family oxidoreductase [bacterium]
MNGKFQDKCVVITGVASGLGLRLATIFDKEGATVCGLDVDAGALSLVSEGLSDRFQPYICDLTDRDQITSTFANIYAVQKEVDILVNNAGIVFAGTLGEQQPEQIEKTFAVNTISHFYTIQAVFEQMKASNRGHIVTIASAGGFVGTPKLSAYTASKFAVVGMEESLRAEIRMEGLNIQTTLIAPYFINTGMFEGVKTRFSWLLPILDQDMVSQRIAGAIYKKKRRLILPWFVYTVFPMRLLPVNLFDSVCKFFGITRVMDHFKGRTQD